RRVLADARERRRERGLAPGGPRPDAQAAGEPEAARPVGLARRDAGPEVKYRARRRRRRDEMVGAEVHQLVPAVARDEQGDSLTGELAGDAQHHRDAGAALAGAAEPAGER